MRRTTSWQNHLMRSLLAGIGALSSSVGAAEPIADSPCHLVNGEIKSRLPEAWGVRDCGPAAAKLWKEWQAVQASLPPLPTGMTREQWNAREIEHAGAAVSELTNALAVKTIPVGAFDRFEAARRALDLQEKQRTVGSRQSAGELQRLRRKLEQVRNLYLAPVGSGDLETWTGPSQPIRLDASSLRIEAEQVAVQAKAALAEGRCTERTRLRVNAAWTVTAQQGQEPALSLRLLMEECAKLQTASKIVHRKPDQKVTAADFLALATQALKGAAAAASDQEKKTALKSVTDARIVGGGVGQTPAVVSRQRELSIASVQLLRKGGPHPTDQAIQADGTPDLAKMRALMLDSLKQQGEQAKGLAAREADPTKRTLKEAMAYNLSQVGKQQAAGSSKAAQLATTASCHSSQGRSAQAIQTQRAGIAELQKTTPDDLPRLLGARGQLITYLRSASRWAEALTEIDASIALVELAMQGKGLLPAPEPVLVNLYETRSDVLFEQGDFEASRLAHEKAKSLPQQNSVLAVYDQQVKAMIGNFSYQDQFALERELRVLSPEDYVRVLDSKPSLNAPQLLNLARAQAATGQHEAAARTLEQAAMAAQNDMTHLRHLGGAGRMHFVSAGLVGAHEGPALTLALRQPGKGQPSQLAFLIAATRKDAAFQTLGRVATQSARTTPATLRAARELRSKEAAAYLAGLHEPLKASSSCENGKPPPPATFAQDSVEVLEQHLFEPDGFKKAATAGRLLIWAPLNRSAFRPVAQPYFEAVQKTLPLGTVLFDFVRYGPDRLDHPSRPSTDTPIPPRYAVFVVQHGQATPELLDLGSAESIDALATDLRHLLSTPPTDEKSGASSTLKARAQALYSTLFPEQAKKWLVAADRVLVVPDGALRQVPFDALHDGTHWFVEQHHVSYLLSARELLQKASTSGTSRNTGVVFADPPPPAARYGDARLQPKRWATLPFTKAEGQAISALFPGTRVFEGGSVTERALLDVASPTFLHVAGHATVLGDGGSSASATTRGTQFRPRTPVPTPPTAAQPRDPWLQATLVVGPPATQGTTEDSFVTAFEITRMDLRGTEMVVLSACDSGTGTSDSHGVHSLGRAFMLAGARSVVATQWSLEDQSAVRVMQDFYAGLARGEQRRAALRDAQLSELGRHPHPFFWSPWALFGRDGRLPAPTKTSVAP